MTEDMWHGSPKKGLTYLVPGSVSGESELDLVYASTSWNTALMFTLLNGPGHFIFDEAEKRVFLEKSREELGGKDRGGVVYRVNRTGFARNKDALIDEWTARNASVVNSRRIGSMVRELSRSGVEIYANFLLFCDIEEWMLRYGKVISERQIKRHRPANILWLTYYRVVGGLI